MEVISNLDYAKQYETICDRVARIRREMRIRLVGFNGSTNYSIYNSSLKDVKKVCLILSASRSGSSVFVDTLKTCLNSIYFLQGEDTPFYKTYKMDYPLVDTDFNDPTPTQLEEIGKDLISDFWKVGTSKDRKLSSQELLELVLGRLAFQIIGSWENIPIKKLRTIIKNRPEISVKQLLEETLKNCYSSSFSALQYYDPPLLNESLGANPPINRYLIEEAPFVAFNSDYVPATPEDMENSWLVIKNPSNIFRLNLIRKLYPNAEFKYLFMVRNPAATINGLMDGWLHHGFYSYFLPDHELKVNGYKYSKFWNFDLFPKWKDHLGSTRLEELCFWQWYHANEKICDWVGGHDDSRVLKFEDFIDLKTRPQVIKEISDFLEVESIPDAACGELNTVMATKPPSPERWRLRAAEITPFFDVPQYKILAEKMGYASREER